MPFHLLFTVLLLAGPAPEVRAPAAAPVQPSVLFLIGLRSESPAGNVFGPLLQQDLAAALHNDIDSYVEYMDPDRFPEAGYLDALETFIRSKYQNHRFDLVIAADRLAHNFLARSRARLFPDTPVVFFTSDSRDTAFSRSTGLQVTVNFSGALDTALALQPDVERVFVVSGASPFDKYYEAAVREQFAKIARPVAFTYLSGMPMPALLDRLGNLPPRSIVFLVTCFQDGSGQRFATLDMIERVTAAASAPVYSWITVGMGHGVVGGRILSVESIAESMVALAVRVLKGENPERIPMAQGDFTVLQFDARQLRRWSIAEGRIPAGSTILFREPGAWEQYKIYFIPGIVLLALQSVTIAALLVQRVRRRRIETALRESERRLGDSAQRFTLAAEAGSIGIWEWNATTRKLHTNSQFRQMLGFDEAELPDRVGAVLARVHPDDLPMVKSNLQACIDEVADEYRMEHRMLHKDGSVRWLMAQGALLKDAEGRTSAFVGTTIDVTERKRDMEAIRERDAGLEANHREIQTLAGRLIAAQEAERTRIARDLHDDVSQELAGLSIGLSTLKRRVGTMAGGDEILGQLGSLQQRAIALAGNVRHLSHDLHPGILQHAGLVAALTAYCEEMGRIYPLIVTLHTDGDLEALDSNTGLCLYRIAQEALRNVVTHAHARRVDVRLVHSANATGITIADDGGGFDIAKARQSASGLGLISIGERVRLAGGTLSVTSEPGTGTRVQVQIPSRALPARDAVASSGV